MSLGIKTFGAGGSGLEGQRRRGPLQGLLVEGLSIRERRSQVLARNMTS